MSLSQKEIAVRFLELAAAGEVDEAYGNYTAPNFKHHNPYYAGDKTSLKEGMKVQLKPQTKFLKFNMSLRMVL